MKTITIEQFCRARRMSLHISKNDRGYIAYAIRHEDFPALVSGNYEGTPEYAIRSLCEQAVTKRAFVVPGDTMPPITTTDMPSGYSSEIPIDTYAYLRHKHNLTVADIMSLTGLSKDQVTYGCPELDSFFERIS